MHKFVSSIESPSPNIGSSKDMIGCIDPMVENKLVHGTKLSYWCTIDAALKNSIQQSETNHSKYYTKYIRMREQSTKKLKCANINIGKNKN